jgi:hypothetical protein
VSGPLCASPLLSRRVQSSQPAPTRAAQLQSSCACFQRSSYTIARIHAALKRRIKQLGIKSWSLLLLLLLILRTSTPASTFLYSLSRQPANFPFELPSNCLDCQVLFSLPHSLLSHKMKYGTTSALYSFKYRLLCS